MGHSDQKCLLCLCQDKEGFAVLENVFTPNNKINLMIIEALNEVFGLEVSIIPKYMTKNLI